MGLSSKDPNGRASGSRPTPTWVTVIVYLSAVAGIGSLFIESPLDKPLGAFALAAAALYFVERYRASGRTDR